MTHLSRRHMISSTLFAAGMTPLATATATGGRRSAEQGGDRPLVDAVSEFNHSAWRNGVGRDQPPLTEEEVIAAVSWIVEVDRRTPLADPPLTADEIATLAVVVKSRALPAGWRLNAISHFQPDADSIYERWSVRITMPRRGGNATGTYSHPIRERFVARRLIGPAERRILEEMQKGVGSFERVRLSREREAAILEDKLNAARAVPADR